jgi:hypothetical protein
MRIEFAAAGGVHVIIGTVIEAITGVLISRIGISVSHLVSLSLSSLVHPLWNRLTTCRLNSRATSCVNMDLVCLKEIYI